MRIKVGFLMMCVFINGCVFGQVDINDKVSDYWHQFQSNLFDDLLVSETDKPNHAESFIVIKTDSYNDTTRVQAALLDKRLLTTMIFDMKKDQLLGYSLYDSMVVLMIGNPCSSNNYKKVFPLENLVDYKTAIRKLKEPADSTVIDDIRTWHLISIHQLVVFNCIYDNEVVNKYILEHSTVYN